jgi:hypothetical protein
MHSVPAPGVSLPKVASKKSKYELIESYPWWSPGRAIVRKDDLDLLFDGAPAGIGGDISGGISGGISRDIPTSTLGRLTIYLPYTYHSAYLYTYHA